MSSWGIIDCNDDSTQHIIILHRHSRDTFYWITDRVERPPFPWILEIMLSPRILNSKTVKVHHSLSQQNIKIYASRCESAPMLLAWIQFRPLDDQPNLGPLHLKTFSNFLKNHQTWFTDKSLCHTVDPNHSGLLHSKSLYSIICNVTLRIMKVHRLYLQFFTITNNLKNENRYKSMSDLQSRKCGLKKYHNGRW